MDYTGRTRPAILLLMLLFFIPVQVKSQDYHERLFRVFSNTAGITDNHNGYINYSPGKLLNFHGSMTLFTERFRNQSFSFAADVVPLRTGLVDIAAGIHFRGTFGDIEPAPGIPVSFLFHTVEHKLTFLVQPEAYWNSGFRIGLNTEGLFIFPNSMFISAAMKSSQYLPESERIFSLSAGLTDKILISKISVHVPDDINFHQAMVTVSAGLRFIRE